MFDQAKLTQSLIRNSTTSSVLTRSRSNKTNDFEGDHFLRGDAHPVKELRSKVHEPTGENPASKNHKKKGKIHATRAKKSSRYTYKNKRHLTSSESEILEDLFWRYRLKKQQVADAMGVHKSQLSRILNGKCATSLGPLSVLRGLVTAQGGSGENQKAHIANTISYDADTESMDVEIRKLEAEHAHWKTFVENVRSILNHPFADYLFAIHFPYYLPCDIALTFNDNGFVNIEPRLPSAGEPKYVMKIDTLKVSCRTKQDVQNYIPNAIHQLRMLGLTCVHRAGKSHKEWDHFIKVYKGNRELCDFRMGPPRNQFLSRSYDCTFEIRGYAQALRLGPLLTECLLRPVAKWSTVVIRRIDVALDMDLQFAALLPFGSRFYQNLLNPWDLTHWDKYPLPHLSKNKRADRHTKYDSSRAKTHESKSTHLITSHTLGSDRSKRRISIYDKRQEQIDKGYGFEGIEYASSWSHITRIEAQIELGKKDHDLSLDEFFVECPNYFGSLHVIDLRTIDSWDPFIHHAVIAKSSTVEEYYTRFGKRVENRVTPSPAMRFSETPTRIQNVLKKRFIEEADKWPYPHPSVLFEHHRASLQRQLDAILGIKSTRRRDLMLHILESPIFED